MSAAAEETEENHWPGFVDALSTIVMVVTFLLIILAIAIFALSLNVAKVAGMTPSPTQSTNMDEKIEILVESNPTQMDVDSPAQVMMRSTRAIVMRFQGTTLSIDEASNASLGEFIRDRADKLANAQLVLTAYFDAAGAGYAKNQRIGYYRAMAVRNTLLGRGYEPDQIKVYVREAPSTTQIDTVEVTRE